MQFDFKRSYLKFWHDYEFSPSRYNWVEFTFINCSFDYDRVTLNYEVHVALLGVHCMLTWITKAGEQEWKEPTSNS